MYKIAVLIFCCFICQINAKPDKCEKKNINDCVKEYKKAVLDGKGHCDRLQVMISCLARDSSCYGNVISSFRVWMLQMGLMDKIMSKCLLLDTNALRALLADTKESNPTLFVDSVTSDPNEPCAQEAHDRCVSNYIQDIRKSKKELCTAVNNLNQCYKNVEQSGECDAAIIKDFVKILDNVATRVTQVLHSEFPKICSVVSRAEL